MFLGGVCGESNSPFESYVLKVVHHDLVRLL